MGPSWEDDGCAKAGGMTPVEGRVSTQKKDLKPARTGENPKRELVRMRTGRDGTETWGELRFALQ